MENFYTIDTEVWTKAAAEDADELLTALEAFGAQAVVVTSGRLRVGARFTLEVDDDALAFGEGRMMILGALDKAGISHRGIARLEVMDDRYADVEFGRPTEELVGVTEVAEMLGVSRQRASELQTREGFPAPIAHLASGPVWKRSALGRFVETWERRPGRPRKTGVQAIAETGLTGAQAAADIARTTVAALGEKTTKT